LYRLLTKLDRNIYHPIVISLIKKGVIAFKIEKLGIRVYSLGLSSIFNLIPTLIKLASLLRSFNPQIVHTFMIHSAFFGGIIAKLLNIPTIIWNIFSTDLSLQTNKVGTTLIIKVCALLSRIIPNKIILDSHSAYSAHEIEGYSFQKMEIINNGVDTDKFSPNGKKYNQYRQKYFREDELVIGLIARYHPVKGHNIFIKAINIIMKKVSNVKFLLNGSNIEISNDKLMNMINKENINKLIHISDSQLKITDILFSCDIIVSSSKSESFPNIICEAMASEIPCVVTDVGDCSRIVGDTGLIVNPNDSIALANAIIKLIKMPLNHRMELGKQARKRIYNNFSIERMTEKYYNLYRSFD